MISLSFYRSLESYTGQLFEYLEKNCLAEDQVRDKLTPERISKLASGNLQLEFGVSRKSIQRLSPKERINLAIFLILVEYYFKGETPRIFDTWKFFIFERLEKYLKNHLTFSVLFELSEANQIVLIEKYLQNPKNSRIFWSSLSKKKKKEAKFYSLWDKILLGYLDIKVQLIDPKRARKPQFRKGYRDHGSLGTGLLQIIREEQSDVFLKEQERNRQIKKILTILHLNHIYFEDFKG